MGDRELEFDNPRRMWVHVKTIRPARAAEGWIEKQNILQLNSLLERHATDIPALIAVQSKDVQQAWRDVDKGINEMEKAIKENDKKPTKEAMQPLAEPYFARAEIWSLANCRDEAMRDYSTGLGIVLKSGQGPEKYGPYIAKLKEAVDKYERQPRPAEKGSYETYLSYGVTAYRNGKLELAIRHLSNAIQIDHGGPVAWYFRGLTYKRLKQDLQAQHDVLVAVYLERRGGRFGEYARWFIDVQGPLRSWMEEYRLGDTSQKIITGATY